MDISDYLIDQNGKNWVELLAGWVPPLPNRFTLWLVNRFGDVFAIFEDGSVHMLDVGTGRIERVADNQNHFCSQIDIGNDAENWLMIPLVDRCVTAGMKLGDHQCYGYKIPPILGGEYGVENFEPTDLSVHYSLLADIYRQTRDLQDGTKIRLVVGSPPDRRAR